MSKALAESGADVALMYVSSETTHDTAAAIGKEFGVTCKAYKADIGNAEQVQKAVDQIHKDFGSIDVFVANAGISSRGAAEVKKLSFRWGLYRSKKINRVVLLIDF